MMSDISIRNLVDPANRYAVAARTASSQLWSLVAALGMSVTVVLIAIVTAMIFPITAKNAAAAPHILSGHSDIVTSVVRSLDGKTLASGFC